VTGLQLLDFRGRPRLPAIRQAEAAECGLACLAMIASFHGHEVDLNALRRRFPVSLKGVTLKDLMQIGTRLGLAGRALRLEPENLRKLRLPAILHWDMNHFVVLRSVGRKQVTIHDPALGVRALAHAELSGHMTGVALELTPTQGFERRREQERVGIFEMVGRVSGFGRALGQALALSLILQLFVLASPFYMQIAVDEAVVKGDEGLLAALAIGFALFALINVTATWLRAIVSLQLGNVLSFQMVIRLFHHMMRLPLPFFERRHIGDLISRFHSTQPIKELLTEGLVAVLVDGLMALGTLGLMFVYSGRLALVVLTAVTLYVTLRLTLLRPLRSRTGDQIQAQARQDSTFIETVRAIQSIKLFGREAERESVWQNRYAGFINAGIRLGRLQVSLKAVNDFIYATENVVTIYLGARLALDGAITIGMLFAFMAYKQQFLDKVARLVEKGIDLRMLDLHLDRLGDIALARPERGHDEPLNLGRVLAGAIELRGVAFRYAEMEPCVFEGVDLQIEPGEFVAITGPSGGGKTTLMKLMVGLFEPTAGQVLIDGFPLHALGLQSARAQIGAVMQDDHLLSGSIVENIAFFDPATDLSWVEACAEMAGIHTDIMHMPMGYNTLIGDMGSTLSGGQRQRVLLARALYRKPRILFLDEGTSHLDPAIEAQVNAALATLAITRVIIAHRPQTVAAATRVLRLESGRLGSHTASATPLRGWAADASTASR
jgi:ATP-binding cassette, subfamily B, bacterial CvaB/MchF/RaxB